MGDRTDDGEAGDGEEDDEEERRRDVRAGDGLVTGSSS